MAEEQVELEHRPDPAVGAGCLAAPAAIPPLAQQVDGRELAARVRAGMGVPARVDVEEAPARRAADRWIGHADEPEVRPARQEVEVPPRARDREPARLEI